MYNLLKREIFQFSKVKAFFVIVILMYVTIVMISQNNSISNHLFKSNATKLEAFTINANMTTTITPQQELSASVNQMDDEIESIESIESVATNDSVLLIRTEETLLMPSNSVETYRELLLSAERQSNMALLYEIEWKKYSRNIHWKIPNALFCNTEFPSPNIVLFNNIYWQQFLISNEFIIYLYNAYYDRRESTPRVRIIAVTNQQNEAESLKLGCLLWFEKNKRPLLSKVVRVFTIWPKIWSKGRTKLIYGTLLITCDVPNGVKHLVPKAISLIKNANSCTNDKVRNALRVIYNKPAVRQEFAICVQALRFAGVDYSVRLIEWLELVKLLGAHRVFFYKLAAHENMDKVFDYYIKKGFIDIKHLTLSGHQLNTPELYEWYHNKRLVRFQSQELVELNDCLYRNLYSYKYIAIFDVDEIIVPTNAYNWSQLMQQIQNSITNKSQLKKYGYYDNRNTHVYKNLVTETFLNNNGFVDNETIASYLYTMSHIHRKAFTRSGANVKCFHVVDNVEAVHNHYPIKCLDRKSRCLGHKTNPKHSYLLHYKKSIGDPNNCNKIEKKECAITDTVMWRYYDKLHDGVKTAIRDIFN